MWRFSVADTRLYKPLLAPSVCPSVCHNIIFYDFLPAHPRQMLPRIHYTALFNKNRVIIVANGWAGARAKNLPPHPFKHTQTHGEAEMCVLRLDHYTDAKYSVMRRQKF